MQLVKIQLEDLCTNDTKHGASSSSREEWTERTHTEHQEEFQVTKMLRSNQSAAVEGAENHQTNLREKAHGN